MLVSRYSYPDIPTPKSQLQNSSWATPFSHTHSDTHTQTPTVPTFKRSKIPIQVYLFKQSNAQVYLILHAEDIYIYIYANDTQACVTKAYIHAFFFRSHVFIERWVCQLRLFRVVLRKSYSGITVWISLGLTSKTQDHSNSSIHLLNDAIIYSAPCTQWINPHVLEYWQWWIWRCWCRTRLAW